MNLKKATKQQQNRRTKTLTGNFDVGTPLQNFTCIASPGAAVQTFPHLLHGKKPFFFSLLGSLFTNVVFKFFLQNFKCIANPGAAVQIFPHIVQGKARVFILFAAGFDDDDDGDDDDDDDDDDALPRLCPAPFSSILLERCLFVLLA